MKLQFTGTVEVPDVVFEAYKPTPIAQAQYIGERAGAFTPAVEPDFGPYAGKLAYLEADYVNKDGSIPTYENGEYAIIRTTPGTISGVRLCVGYDGHKIKTFPLIGSQKWRIVDACEGDRAIQDFLREQLYFSQAPARGDKLAWIPSVYSDAAAVVRQLQRAFDFKIWRGR